MFNEFLSYLIEAFQNHIFRHIVHPFISLSLMLLDNLALLSQGDLTDIGERPEVLLHRFLRPSWTVLFAQLGGMASLCPRWRF